jgi:predicted RNase H-like nuclease (RuvC/YqgF family)
MTDVGFEILPDDGCATCQQLDEHRHMLQRIIIELEEEIADLENDLELRVDAVKQSQARLCDLVKAGTRISELNLENAKLRDRITKLEYMIACNVDPMNCTDEDAELCIECHKTAFPENYRKLP